ncbi:MAG: transglutaminase-like domain-containing protein [Gemmatimonadota bacterium]
MSRRGLAIGILALWVVLLSWHVRREYFEPELTRLAEATLTLAPGTYFYALRMGDQTIGISSSRLDTIPEGFLLEDQMNLDLQAMGQPGAVTVLTQVVLAPTLTMREFSFSLSSTAGDIQASGTVQGDSLLRVTIEGVGGPETLDFRLTEAPLLASALPIRLAKGGELREGRQLRFPVFDPSSVSIRTVEVDVLERGILTLPDSAIVDEVSGVWRAASSSEVPAWRLRETYGGISLESWIDEDGRVIRSSSAMGFSIERTAYELAIQDRDAAVLAAGQGAVGSDLILSTAIASNVDLGEVTEYDELRFHLSGVDLSGFHLDGGRQELRGDTLVVRREEWGALEPGYTLPYPRMDLREALEPEPLIQSGDPGLVDVARTLGGVRGFGGANPRTVAQRLHEAVFSSLEKTVSFTLPSALQVLETMRGDCNEHTVLYVALARAVGLPARVAVGLVYLEGSFYYHAWPEVWLGEWVAVDPTLGQLPADAAHLRFMTGNLAQQVEIARLIGTLRIEVLDRT